MGLDDVKTDISPRARGPDVNAASLGSRLALYDDKFVALLCHFRLLLLILNTTH